MKADGGKETSSSAVSPRATEARPGIFQRGRRILFVPYLLAGTIALVWILVLDNAPILFAWPVCALLALPFLVRAFTPRWYTWSAAFLVTSILVLRLVLDIWLPV